MVIDTNVARALDSLREPGAPKTYDASERWVRDQATRIDLRQFHSDVPRYSQRLVQQAVYAFCSKSNRVARGDHWARDGRPASDAVLVPVSMRLIVSGWTPTFSASCA